MRTSHERLLLDVMDEGRCGDDQSCGDGDPRKHALATYRAQAWTTLPTP